MPLFKVKFSMEILISKLYNISYESNYGNNIFEDFN